MRREEYYRVYTKSLDTIKDVYDKIEKINEKYPYDQEKIYYFDVDVQTTYMLALNVLGQKINLLLVDFLKNLNHKDCVKFYDANSYKMFEKYQDVGFGCVADTISSRISINAPLENTINDVFGLVHEVSHLYKFVYKYRKENVAFMLLGEVIPIYSELLTYEYLIENYGNRTSFYNEILEKFDSTKMYTYNQFDKETCDRINVGQFKYSLGFIIALYLYDRHKIDPYTTEVDILNYALKLGKADFNQLMSILKVPIRIDNDKIYFTKNGLEELLKTYESNLISFVDNFNKAVKREEKYINNGVIKVLSK